ncbi:hypothetical protein PIB30_070836 [Stylosanthes scabra]|uniref:Ribonuclease H1 N-terminal domain-containing protein n=1 Tax=Stylosanthes scabra TaxID=79078 RepID=A0ABU6ZME0_9FABA|nr:hypothetical protein [Stylosanthes scabra]
MAVSDGGECYVVFKGKKPKVYVSWEEVELHVTGFSGCLHRKFPSFEAGSRALVEFLSRKYGAGPSRFNEATLMSQSEHSHAPGLSATTAGLPVFAGKGSYTRPVAHSPGDAIVHYLPVFPSAATTYHGTSPTLGDQQSGNAEVGVALACMKSAVPDLQGRVSQMEYNRLELLMKLGEICDNISALYSHKERIGNVPDEQDRGGDESCILVVLVELTASMGVVGKSLMKRLDEHERDVEKLSGMTEDMKALLQAHDKEAEQLGDILAELRRNTTIMEACLDAFVQPRKPSSSRDLMRSPRPVENFFLRNQTMIA